MADATREDKTEAAAAVPAAEAETPEPKKKLKKKILELPSRIHTWPYLVRLEFICAIIVMIVMTVWSITIDAPTEQAADPNRTPNPSKAPWYFLGLQEMLVYFDPWYAGVVLPSFIIIGLMVIPYIDINPRGNGYYTVKERKFALTMFLFGFLVLWIALIVIGTFFRGPGWNLFWPWQYWDPHKTVALTNVDLPYKLGIRSEFWTSAVGALCVLGFYPGMAIVGQFFLRKRPIYKELGAVRYHIVAFLFFMMMALPLKMALRLGFNIKYIWVTQYFNI